MSASDLTSPISSAEAHVWKDDLSDGFVAEIFADGQWRLPTAGSQPPSIPDTSEKLLDYIKAIRKRLLQAHKVGGSQALNCHACTSTTMRDKAVFVCTSAGDFYCVPAIAPLWMAVAALVESGLPPFHSDPRSITETVQMLAALAERLQTWCGLSDEPPPPEGAKFSEENAPPAFREGGKTEGKVLTTPYLAESPDWLLRGPYISKNYGPRKPLTTYIKIGRRRAYIFRELLVLRTVKTQNEEAREARR